MMIVICVGIVAVFLLAYMVVQILVKNTLLQCFEEQDFVRYDQVLNSTKAKLVLPAYNIEYMRFNGYLMQGNKKQIDAQFEKLWNARKNKTQTQAFLQRGLQYYIEQKDSKKCHKILDAMKQYMEPQVVTEATYTVDILVDGKFDHIAMIEERLQQANEEQKPIYLYLLQKQYENCQDLKQAKIYESKLKEWKERNVKCI